MVHRGLPTRQGERLRHVPRPKPLTGSTPLPMKLAWPPVHAGRVLLISDFDGTLSEIVANADDARLAPGAARVLALLAKTLLRVCILSSRGSQQLSRLVR